MSRFHGFCRLALWAVFSGAVCRHSTVVSVTYCLVPSVVAPECVVPRPRGVSEVQSGSAYGPSTLWRSKVAVPMVRHCFSHGCLVSLVVTPGCPSLTSWRSGMLVLVLRLWSLLVAPVFHELRCLDGCALRVCFRVVLLWADSSCGSWRCSSCFLMCLTSLVLWELSLT
ncbi:hypothetical protein Taro_048740 [Colocasia esculenta]|uniref:Secreted protein n=1 Tax=Colocasia esculenta TaxID=4460 RepID=A0A843X8Z4_COLES|nr:hypothetical protein [Colocasia esculenta]